MALSIENKKSDKTGQKADEPTDRTEQILKRLETIIVRLEELQGQEGHNSQAIYEQVEKATIPESLAIEVKRIADIMAEREQRQLQLLNAMPPPPSPTDFDKMVRPQQQPKKRGFFGSKTQDFSK